MYRCTAIALFLSTAALLPQAAQAQACDLFQEVSCNTSYRATVSGYALNTYACDPTVNYAGDDMAVWVTPPTSTPMMVELRPGPGTLDPDVMVSTGTCDGGCTAYNPRFGKEQASWLGTGGQTYLVSFDDRYDALFGLGSNYTIDFDVWCGAGTCDPVLDIQANLTCSSTQVGSTPSTVGNELRYYDCPDANVRGFDPLWQTNPEAIYTFTPQATGPVTFRLTNMTNDQDLYILADACDPASCIAASTDLSINDDFVTFQAVIGHTYYIVVEGFEGPGNYTLDFDNTGGGCPEDCTDLVDNDLDTLVDCDDPDCWGQPECACDNDGDTYDGPQCGGPDCDDRDSTIHPGATEVCNGIDDNCVNGADEGVPTQSWYLDADGDSYGGPTTTVSCAAPAGYASQGGDCADGNPAIHPGATEVCNGIDDDCFGGVDNGITVPSWWPDGDGDAWGAGAPVTACAAPPSHVGRAGDCQDADPAVHPGRAEVCNGVDDNCDGGVDEGLATLTYFQDGDGDGYGGGTTATGCRAPAGFVSSGGDCQDGDPAIHPGVPEVCDGVDNDCDNIADEGLPTQPWYLDGDGDTWGGDTTTTACRAPQGYVGQTGDCQDALPAIHPGATDGCDGIDNDCDTLIDEDGDQAVWYLDGDQDGFGGTTSAQQCAAPSGYVGQTGDCQDDNAAVNPGAAEVCDGVDNDCDTLVDDADPDVDASTGALWYADEDGDQAGDAATAARACTQPAGRVASHNDCDDQHDTRAPGLTETCDGVDNDCDLTVDEGTSCYDDDGDGTTEQGGDCDDAHSATHPGAAETCDGVDNDCDLTVDEGTSCYDDDGDGVTEADGDCNDADASVSPDRVEIQGNGVDDDCDGSVDGASFDPDGDGVTVSGGDCVEGDPNAHPGAPERPNGQDDDCDGVTDEGTRLYDDDGDGVTEADGDCNDDDATVFPGAPETANGVDDDCNGLVDDGGPGVDDDGDGLSEDEGDCDDTDPLVHPGADDRDNNTDDDCDGVLDEAFDDLDGDGVTVAEGDCDDHNGWVGPGRVEMCDGVDNNCDNVVDETCDDTSTIDFLPRGCSCTTGGPTPWSAGWPLALILLAARRRRGVAVGLAAAAVAGCKTDTAIGNIDARIAVSPAVFDVGDVAVGTATTFGLEVLQLEGPSVTVRAVDVFNVDGDAFAFTGELPVIPPRGAATLVLTYAPSTPGYHRASVTVISDAARSTELEVVVRGHAVPLVVDVWPRVLDFGDVASGDAAVRPLTLYNDGALPWTAASVTVPLPFSLASNLPVTVNPGDTATIPLLCSPEDDTPLATTATITTNEGVAVPPVLLRANDCESGLPSAYDVDEDGVTSCGGDCDDGDPSAHPGALETIDGVDNDCDGLIDDGTLAYDDDGDGTSELEGDCNDGDATVNVGLPERYGDGVDNDCDGVVDQGTTDGDADGVSPGGGDCDDLRADVHPGAPELPDGRDNNCDGLIDEGTVLADDDGDGFCESPIAPCSDGAQTGDCDDTPEDWDGDHLPDGAAAAPGRPETADGRDNDCDGLVDEGTAATDDDGDGFSERGGDCDDTNPAVSPAALERPGNGVDDDCDPSTPA